MVLVKRHKRGVDQDTQGDKKINERVHDEEFDVVGERVPAGTALKKTEG